MDTDGAAGGTAHWDAVYRARAEDRLTWFEATPTLSLELIARHAVPGRPVIDVGGGASRLAEALVARGVGPVTVLDLSPEALAASRARMGAAAAQVDWIAADVTGWVPDRRYGLWHDRAVFHFLTDAAQRAGYLRALDAALDPDGAAILMTFAEDGPETCSGLPVRRYSPDTLAAEVEAHLPGRFRLAERGRHVHVTPKGNRQAFQLSVLRRQEQAE
ncbi:class I SAM-dependent methyltransferase [Psychromarinibacter sp. C21-152]|uniref:Class I SAM-dependent methyltransferase n=1 Tax=Psychromarinibacter sediminicola TaxID=3033385 RepID=A0AAE3NKZ6_9RHOB|nr:class I SAM-dependent methyltransferase [Psychromarinibacter sediminicola]MDF0599838.1 class I SAM-dependent methyltransferase [Psychromarinibacter sediminicola]